jgi:hypothetical protein
VDSTDFALGTVGFVDPCFDPFVEWKKGQSNRLGSFSLVGSQRIPIQPFGQTGKLVVAFDPNPVVDHACFFVGRIDLEKV